MMRYCFFILFFLSSCTLFQDIKDLASESKDSRLIVATKPSALKNANRKYPRDNLKYLHLRNRNKKTNYFNNPAVKLGEEAQVAKNAPLKSAKATPKNIVADESFPDLKNIPTTPIPDQPKLKKTLQDDLDELHRELEQLNRNLAKETCNTERNKTPAKKAAIKKAQQKKANTKKVKKSKTTTEKCDVAAEPITPIKLPPGTKVKFAPLGRKAPLDDDYDQD
jgi:hypothetical protein